MLRIALLLALPIVLGGCRALGLSGGPVGLGPDARIELVPLPGVMEAQGLPVIPWVAVGTASWQDAPPLFEMASEEADTSARGWAAVSAEAILIKVVVRDDVHHQTRRGGDIWDGDGLQIGVDALGDGAGNEPEGARLTGPDDAELAVALTSDGPTVWAHFHGRPDGEGALPQGYAAIERDDDAGTTTYDIALPWAEFGQRGGFSPAIGLRVQVNDTDGEGVRAINWGGLDNRGRPGRFNRLALAGPPGDFATAAAQRTSLWRATDYGQIAFAAARDDVTEVRARIGEVERTFELPAGPPGALRRFAVRAFPGVLPTEQVSFVAQLVTDSDAIVAQECVDLAAPVRVIEALTERIDELAADSPHPMFTRHLRSAGALVQAEWNRGMMVVDESDQRAQDAVSYARKILEGLRGQAANWDDYARRGRSMVFARIARGDSTLQFYTLQLPTDWDAERTYPLVVDLHGMGPSHPLFYPSLHFGERQPPPKGVSIPPLDEPHFLLAPWARGNVGYGEMGQDDVWEAMRDARKAVKVDEDRQYLMGFSMGGGGTWSIGIRTPDRWAAICIMAGGTWNAPTGIGLGRNAAHLPVRIWHGDSDGAVSVDNAYRMQEDLRLYGNEPDVIILPGQGHALLPDHRNLNVNWLLQHRRKRPDRFEFVADTGRHRGVWGIWMNRDPHHSYQPRFRCRIEGGTVCIDSEGTPGLNVDLGAGGLGLEGEVTVIWNGEQVYQGPPKQVELGTGGGWRR